MIGALVTPAVYKEGVLHTPMLVRVCRDDGAIRALPLVSEAPRSIRIWCYNEYNASHKREHRH
jgi:hypothetical protein